MSGSTIGGFIGGAIGAALAPATGGLSLMLYSQVGFMVGSAIGGYVDPIKTKGPQITDAAAQTSTVGGVIPFGYGTFTTAGNLIWRDKLIEHKDTKRVGKGGSQKQTTYTYTRSYAIGICQGEIQGLKWIKRNGKKVWTSDPNAPVEDRDFAAKWAQKLTIYTGTESQMPDATITAVEGMGNAGANRGLAYVVIKDDDLTDAAGAVAQYEFCVIVTPPEAYLTSLVYDQLISDEVSLGLTVESAKLKVILRDLTAGPSATTLTVGVESAALVPPLSIVDQEQIALTVGVESAVLAPPLSITDQQQVTFTVGVESSRLVTPASGHSQSSSTLNVSVENSTLTVI